jgi:hypothetical protein
MLSGIEDWVGRKTFAEEKKVGFTNSWTCPMAYPVMTRYPIMIVRLPPGVFADAFLSGMKSALSSLAGDQVCLDGKTLRGSPINGKAVPVLLMQRKRDSS